LELVPHNPGAFLLSGQSQPGEARPFEVARLGPGGVRWSRMLDHWVNPSDARYCGASAAGMSGGLVIACGYEGQVSILHLSEDGTRLREGEVLLPECYPGGLVELQIDASRWPLLLIGGARPSGNVGQGCAWVGTLTVQ
jgi:hypothetical protein